MAANHGDEPVMAEMPLYGDEEVERASGVPLPSLRVLQAAGAIRSHKVAKEHGGYRRMWSEMDLFKASIAAALGKHFAWNIRVVAAVMANDDRSSMWNTVITTSLKGRKKDHLEKREREFVHAPADDWMIKVFDRKFVVLRFPDFLTGGIWEQKALLGFVGKDTFIETRAAEEVLGEERFRKLSQIYQLANFLSEATINLNMQVRATWRRLHRLKPQTSA